MGVSRKTIEKYGVISRETAEAMALRAREILNTDIAISITGIAGNEEVEEQKPGTMHIALADGEKIEYSLSQYYQGRSAAKRRAVLTALTLLRTYLMEEK